MRTLLTSTLIFLSFLIHAQDVQWAAELAEVSSEVSEKQYSAKQALGEPSAYPQSDYNPTAWSPKKEASGKGEFIQVKYDNPIPIRQVVIVENHNPGAIERISVFSTGGLEHEIYKKTPGKIDKKTRLLNIILPQITNYKVRQVRVELNTKAVEGFNCIDAIGISESTKPVTVSIPLAEESNFSEKAENLGNAINSTTHDYIPQISPDGTTLYYTRVGHPENLGPEKYHNVWYSKRVNNKWDVAQKMPEPINNEVPNFLYNITPDGNTILLGDSYDEEVYLSEIGVTTSKKTKDGWSQPERAIIENLHSQSQYNEFFLAANKKVMLMSLDRLEGEGANDIYVSFLIL